MQDSGKRGDYRKTMAKTVGKLTGRLEEKNLQGEYRKTAERLWQDCRKTMRRLLEDDLCVSDPAF